MVFCCMEGVVLGSVDWYDSPLGRRTSCIFFPEKKIVLDAGTGFVNISNYLQSKDELHILISHGHNDHIYGLWPAHNMLRDFKRVVIYGHSHIMKSIDNLFNECSSGYRFRDVKFDLETVLFDNDSIFDVNGVRVETKRLGPHTLRVNCFKLFFGDKTLSYVPDIPISRSSHHGLLEFVNGSDTIIHNCYEFCKPADVKEKAHVTYADELGSYFKGKVKRLILIGMNPELVNEFVKFTNNVFKGLEPWQKVVFPYDGMKFEL